MPSAALPASPLRRHAWLTIAGASTGLAGLLAFLEAAQIYLRQLVVDDPMPCGEIVARTLPSWVTLALLLPLVVPVAGRVRLDRGPRARNLAIHLAAATSLVLVHAALLALYYHALPDTNRPIWALFWKIFTLLCVTDLILYAMIAGGLHAWHSQKELRKRELATAQLQSSLTEARLQALRGQLNPHFLFNTLNAISVLALKNQSAAVVQTLSRLSDLLRASLAAEPRQEVPLARELAFIDGYLEIQQLRFADRLGVVREIDDAALEALVPAMLLQPLVENAVLHGIAPSRGPGQVTIRAEVESGLLRLEVRDTGPGFPAVPGDAGIGLGNTRARLDQLFVGTHVFECTNGPEGGAVVRVVLPLRRDERAGGPC